MADEDIDSLLEQGLRQAEERQRKVGTFSRVRLSGWCVSVDL